MLFPPGRASRIPILAITGTNGKSTTVRMVAAILRQAGRNVGLTTTSGIYFNEHLLKAAAASGPRSAAMVLRNPAVDVAVLETARGGRTIGRANAGDSVGQYVYVQGGAVKFTKKRNK